jgi:hypothetical protein
MKSWPVPGDLRLRILVVLYPHKGEIRFSLCRANRPEVKVLRLPVGLSEAQIHGFLDQIASQVRNLGNLGREPRPDRLDSALVGAKQDFYSGLADVMSRGGWKSGDDGDSSGDGDGCQGV